MNTKKLFLSLLPLSESQTICDVGSMDGAEALSFTNAVPGAEVIALEANSENYRAMSKDPNLRQAGVEVLHLAASNTDGEADFHIADVDYSKETQNRGESSLLTGYTRTKRTERVQTVRLDSLLADKEKPISLWIDVEGAAHQVVEGLEKVAGTVAVVHIELDFIPYWEGEVSGHETRQLLESYGFVEIASQFYPDGPGAPGWEEQQENSARRTELFPEYVAEASGNLVLVHQALLEKRGSAIRRRLLVSRLRAFFSRLLGR